MAYDGEDGTDWNRIFKSRHDVSFSKQFQTFKFGLKIIEILHKCCCSVDVLQEIAFNLKCITDLANTS